jgi:hypothetical protein
MKAAFGLRFLPFAFFFAIVYSPRLKRFVSSLIPDFSPPKLRGDVKMPNTSMRVNDFQRENASLSLWRGASATETTLESPHERR